MCGYIHIERERESHSHKNIYGETQHDVNDSCIRMMECSFTFSYLFFCDF